ncbi:YbaB/EbfC family nucleoid-associated protein [Gandjariella thermophila]|uniref:DNA-binding protein n=1 Tax=Gandjariella thermophila TaxID=1931992 RepID=A0A4D4J3V0_9PSEU|nr:YbaB/EbfC family nucleoid-associated protein [Gandjariella thermophila]GDY31355.1 hypothetical protein GTS_29880 [Gandjariella thermophila]
MTTDHRAQVEELLADYRRSREQLASVHRTLASISESVTSDDGLVTATVGPQGTLTGLTIADAAYQRHRPAELAGLVVRTANAAAARAAERAHRALADVLPAETDPEALLRGRADLVGEEIVPPARPAPAEADDEPSFEQQSWLQGPMRRGERP